jgi:hypothetical protein
MADLPIIEATITVANTKDVPYSRNDGTQAVFKSIGHKNPDGTWLNLSCFDELYFPLIVKGAVLKVGYTEKWATEANGQPKMYNGVQVVYRTITVAEQVGGPSGQTTSPQNGSLPTTATVTAASQTYNPGLGAYQTALNCATSLYTAMIEAKWFTKKLDVAEVLATAEVLHGYLVTGKAAPLDQLVDKAKTDLGAEEVDPAEEAARDEQQALADDDIPF